MGACSPSSATRGRRPTCTAPGRARCTDPRNPREVAYWDVDGDNWAAYWYEYGRPDQQRGFDIYASSGVHLLPGNPGEGFQKFRANIRVTRKGMSSLNPQTQEHLIQGPTYQDVQAARAAARAAKRSVAPRTVQRATTTMAGGSAGVRRL